MLRERRDAQITVRVPRRLRAALVTRIRSEPSPDGARNEADLVNLALEAYLFPAAPGQGSANTAPRPRASRRKHDHPWSQPSTASSARRSR